MPSINITESDSTYYRSSSTSSSNIVYVPGPAITGPLYTPTLLYSYNDLVNNFGNKGTVGSLSWDYAASLLVNGLPVLFNRIGITTGDSACSSASLKVNSTAPKITITAKYPGTYGNYLGITIVSSGTSTTQYVITVSKLNESNTSIVDNVLETVRVSTAPTDSNFIMNVSFTNIILSFDSGFATTPQITTISLTALSGGTDTADSAIAALFTNTTGLSGIYSSYSDVLSYQMKFITSGGYTFGSFSVGTNALFTAMINLASTRDDSIAYLDVPEGTDLSTNDPLTLVNTVNSSYGTAYAPWVTMSTVSNPNGVLMPPSFAALIALSSQLKSYAIWYPPAGVNRGVIGSAISTEYSVGQTTINNWQNNNDVAINPIIYLSNYGYVIFGQSTLLSSDSTDTTQSALRSLNVRIVANEIKRVIYTTCLELSFDQNLSKLWNTFKGTVGTYLSSMKNDYGIYDYQVIMDGTTMTTDDVYNRTVNGTVRVSVTRGAEFFNIGFSLSDTGVSFDTNS